MPTYCLKRMAIRFLGMACMLAPLAIAGPLSAQQGQRVNLNTVQGSLQQSGLVIAGCQVSSMTVRYYLSALVGQPVVNGSYTWTAGPGTANDCLPQDLAVWIRVEGSGTYAYVNINPVVPVAGSWGYNVSGSPDWDKYFCGFQENRATQCFGQAEAIAFWNGGIRVTGFSPSRGPGARPGDPSAQAQQQALAQQQAQQAAEQQRQQAALAQQQEREREQAAAQQQALAQRQAAVNADRAAAQQYLQQWQAQLAQQQTQMLQSYDSSDEADVARERQRLRDGLASDAQLLETVNNEVAQASPDQMPGVLQSAADQLEQQADQADHDANSAASLGYNATTLINSLGRILASRGTIGNTSASDALQRKDAAAEALEQAEQARAQRLRDAASQLQQQREALGARAPAPPAAPAAAYSPAPAPTRVITLSDVVIHRSEVTAAEQQGTGLGAAATNFALATAGAIQFNAVADVDPLPADLSTTTTCTVTTNGGPTRQIGVDVRAPAGATRVLAAIGVVDQRHARFFVSSVYKVDCGVLGSGSFRLLATPEVESVLAHSPGVAISVGFDKPTNPGAESAAQLAVPAGTGISWSVFSDPLPSEVTQAIVGKPVGCILEFRSNGSMDLGTDRFHVQPSVAGKQVLDGGYLTGAPPNVVAVSCFLDRYLIARRPISFVQP